MLDRTTIYFSHLPSCSRAVLGCNRQVRALTLQTSKIDIDGIGSQINDVDGEIPLFSTVDCDDEKV